jgi:tetratricopeptide (TPR) repeat protein
MSQDATMSQEDHIKAQIGEAWELHRKGQNELAIAKFDSILRTANDSVDTHYGLALAARAAGETERAVEHFTTAYKLIEDNLTRIRAEHKAGDAENILFMTADDRYMMLMRMTSQRLAELGVEV